ncbi:energy-coupling factor transporter transmembrane component T family protein [Thalassovita aquimarina]|uniref:Energy-coupling factor transporter transmembrane protein EcfT n=1 Tax=Thalassovita aquimarina TaxID=2785917 RepID=A0ABS5HVS8_9RHOB|nr:energy-coupling factor transporter transmembrane component T [Thalassovita aquimarina]MBR9653100.1 energy-coupling factor transporter transmembrane protein EcfT [Thalassovita aquimarina]
MISLTSEYRTPFHALPAGGKLLALCLFTFAVFYLDTVAAALAVTGAVAVAYGIGGMRFARQGLRMMRPVFWMALIILAYHLAIREWAEGAIVVLRLIAAVGLANLVTMTTRLDDMLAVIERMLARIGVSERARRRLALAVALVIRFTPVLAQKGARLIEAWRARSVKRPGWRLVLPIALLAVDDADRVAEALKARSGGL